MKRTHYLILLFFALIFTTSCSNDDDDGSVTDSVVISEEEGEEESNDGIYFPLAINDYWNYDVSNTDNETNTTTVTEDNLYVASQSGLTFSLDVNNGLPANGPIIGLLSSGELTSSETTLLVDGTLELPSEISELIDLEIALTNFVLYDTEANSNTVLASNSDTVIQDFNDYPLTITYELTSTALSFDESLILNGITYSNVATSGLSLNLGVSTTVTIAGIDFPLTLLEPNDILVSTNYYVDGIGLVQANSNTSYQISADAITVLESSGTTLPIPNSGSSTVDQIIIDYSVTAE